MKIALLGFLSTLSAQVLVEGSFMRDVAGKRSVQRSLESALMDKAVPLAEYKANLRAHGLDMPERSRILEQNQREDGGDDDYYMNVNYMYSFSGYSMKFAECQPIQKFSEDAINAGEYTPMVTDDIVVLRLCPTNSCSSSRSYGCYNNYAEYAIGISDYIRVMLRYSMDKKEQMCSWCQTCGARRQLEENAAQDQDDGDQQNDGANEQDQNGEQDDGDNQQNQDNGDQQDDEADQHDREADNQNQQDQDNGDDNNADDGNYDDQNDYAAGDDGMYYAGDDGAAYEYDECEDYATYCYDSNGYSVCDDDYGDDSYLQEDDYLDLLDCVNVNGFYLRPRCDGYDQTISMGVYYDPFCSQYAGDKVSINSLGLGIDPDIFVPFYEETECIDCSQNYYPPYFNANMTMCNRMHVESAVCSTSLQYDLFGGDSDEDNTCSFIESIRFGTYDEEGLLTSKWDLASAVHEVTSEQKIYLAAALLLCGILGIYSCYLHHAITNLLLKSLSHKDLLPKRSRRTRSSRRSRSRSTSRSRSRSRSRKRITPISDDDEEWEKSRKDAGP